MAIIGTSDDRGRSQRFLHLEDYATEARADDRGLEAAKDWIDEHSAGEPVRPAHRLHAPDLTVPAAAIRSVRRYAPGAEPVVRLNALLNAASDS